MSDGVNGAGGIGRNGSVGDREVSPVRGVEFRRAQADDLPALYELDRAMWFNGFALDGDDLSLEFAINDIHHMLSHMTWSRLAVVEGKVQGIIAADVKADGPYLPSFTDRLEDDWNQAVERVRSLEDGERKVSLMLADIEEGERFTRHVQHDTDAEIVLFLLGPSMRGRHLGSFMYDLCLEHLRDMGARTYFLFTDSTCSYGFYDHRGLTRIASMKSQVDIDDLEKYIYVGLTDEIAQRSLRPENLNGQAGQPGHGERERP